jgi:hypothetical protein
LCSFDEGANHRNKDQGPRNDSNHHLQHLATVPVTHVPPTFFVFLVRCQLKIRAPPLIYLSTSIAPFSFKVNSKMKRNISVKIWLYLALFRHSSILAWLPDKRTGGTLYFLPL